MNDFAPQADEDWEQEMGMSPEPDFAVDAAQVFSEELFLPSLSPDPRSRSPSVEITGRDRSPSVEITGYNRASSVASMSPPTRRPVASSDGHDQMAKPHEVQRWATSVASRSRTSNLLFGERTARIVAGSTTAAAQAFFAVLVHVLQRPEGLVKAFKVPAGVTICEPLVMVRSFAQLECDLRV